MSSKFELIRGSVGMSLLILRGSAMVAAEQEDFKNLKLPDGKKFSRKSISWSRGLKRAALEEFNFADNQISNVLRMSSFMKNFTFSSLTN